MSEKKSFSTQTNYKLLGTHSISFSNRKTVASICHNEILIDTPNNKQRSDDKKQLIVPLRRELSINSSSARNEVRWRTIVRRFLAQGRVG